MKNNYPKVRKKISKTHRLNRGRIMKALWRTVLFKRKMKKSRSTPKHKLLKIRRGKQIAKKLGIGHFKKMGRKGLRAKARLMKEDQSYRENISKIMSRAARKRNKNPEYIKTLSASLHTRKVQVKLHRKRAYLKRTKNHKRGVLRAMRSNSKHPNSQEALLKKILDINFPGEFRFNYPTNFILDGKIPDFVNCAGKKILIEMFGDYWHGEKKTGRNKEQEEFIRTNFFAQYGFKTVVVWGADLKM